MVEPWVLQIARTVAPSSRGVPDRHQGVHGLPGLADRHDQGAPADHRTAVAELVRVLHLHREAGPALDRVLGDHPGVAGGAAGDDDDLVHLGEHGLVDAHLVQDQTTLQVRAGPEGVRHGLRLLVDLLGHEGGVAALLRGGGVPRHGEGAALDRCAREVGDGEAVGAHLDHLVLTELHGLAGVVDEGGHVAAEVGRVRGDPDDQRRAGRRAPTTTSGGLTPHRQQRVGTAQALDDLAHGAGEVGPALGEPPAQQVRDDLGVGLGAAARPPARRARRAGAAKFSMMPLWMTATAPSSLTGAGGRCRRWDRRGSPTGCARCRRPPRRRAPVRRSRPWSRRRPGGPACPSAW